MILFIVSFLMAFSISFLCSISEAVLLSLTPGQIADIAKRKPKEALIWQNLKQEIHKPITVILSLNTIAQTMGATIVGSQFAILFGQKWIAVFSILFTYIMLQFTEILPKSLGVRFNTVISSFLALPLAGLVKVLSPLITMINKINQLFVKTKENNKGSSATIDEIASLADLARLSNQIGRHQERIIKTTARLTKLQAKDVMIPLEQITFLSTNQKLSDAIITAHMDPHTRFPIIEGDDKNKVLGYINFKELVYRARTNPADPTLKGIIRPIGFVSPSLPCNLILRSFVEEHTHMTIVRDETMNKTLGLITLEDLVEELVGELEDEFDRLPKMCQSLSGGVWIIGGGLPVAEMYNKTGMSPIPQTTEIVSSWLINKFGKLPKIGQVLNIGEKDITIRRLRRGKIFEILLTPKGFAPKEFM